MTGAGGCSSGAMAGPPPHLYGEEHEAPVVIDDRMMAPQHICTKDSDYPLNLGLRQPGVDMGQVQGEQLRVRKVEPTKPQVVFGYVVHPYRRRAEPSDFARSR